MQIISTYQKIMPINVLNPLNQRGLGTAYKRIFTQIIHDSQDSDLIISLDADNTHNPKQIIEMLQIFNDKSLDLLVASRFCQKSFMDSFPIHRKFISIATSFILQSLFAVKLTSNTNLKDYTSGYRIYKAKKLKELFAQDQNNFIQEPEFTYTCELLIKLARLKAKIEEIPIYYNYNKKIGNSKLRILRNFIRLIVMIFNLSCNNQSHQPN